LSALFDLLPFRYNWRMINGAHILLFSNHPEEDRAFLRDLLNFPAVDAGHGWLIFALPPAEVAVHPAESRETQEQLAASLYLMSDDLNATIAALKQKNVACSALKKERWGIVTNIMLPSGSKISLYQPKHPVAINTR